MKITRKVTEELPDNRLPLTKTVVTGFGSDIQHNTIALSAAEMVQNIRDFKRENPGIVSVEISEIQMVMLFDAFTSQAQQPGTPSSVAASMAVLLTDRMRDSYYSSGTLPGFMGLNWLTAPEVAPVKLTATRLNDGRIMVTENGGPGKAQTTTVYVPEA